MRFNYAIWENTWAIYWQKWVLSDRCIIMLSTHFEQSFQSSHFHRSFLGVKTKRHGSCSTLERGTCYFLLNRWHYFEGLNYYPPHTENYIISQPFCQTIFFHGTQKQTFIRIKLPLSIQWKSMETRRSQAPNLTKSIIKAVLLKGDISWTFSMFKCYIQVPGASTNPENKKEPSNYFLVSLSHETN